LIEPITKPAETIEQDFYWNIISVYTSCFSSKFDCFDFSIL